jgi:hypothetical protein
MLLSIHHEEITRIGWVVLRDNNSDGTSTGALDIGPFTIWPTVEQLRTIATKATELANEMARRYAPVAESTNIVEASQ